MKTAEKGQERLRYLGFNPEREMIRGSVGTQHDAMGKTECMRNIATNTDVAERFA